MLVWMLGVDGDNSVQHSIDGPVFTNVSAHLAMHPGDTESNMLSFLNK